MARLLERAAAMLSGFPVARPLIASGQMTPSQTACQATLLAGSPLNSLPHLVDAVRCPAAQVCTVHEGSWVHRQYKACTLNELEHGRLEARLIRRRWRLAAGAALLPTHWQKLGRLSLSEAK